MYLKIVIVDPRIPGKWVVKRLVFWYCTIGDGIYSMGRLSDNDE